VRCSSNAQIGEEMCLMLLRYGRRFEVVASPPAMVPGVVIEVPVDAAPTAVSVAVGRCAQALGAGRCLMAGDSVGASYHAQIVSDPDGARLTIEFRRGSASGPILAERELIFAVTDAPESCWASAGLVVAGLVAAFDASAETTPAPPPPPRRRAPAASAPTHALLGVDIAALGGPGLGDGPARLGGFGRFWYGWSSYPRVLGLASVRYSSRAGEPRVSWTSLGLGLETRVGSPESLLNLELTGEVVAERFAVSATQAGSGQTAAARQNRVGGRLGLSVPVRLSDRVRLLIGGDAVAMTPPVKVEVENSVVGREPAARFTAFLGFRFAF
jgi:hypothetical protein